MENEKIKALVKEAIEEERRERRQQILWLILESFLIGCIGAAVFIAGLAIILSQGATFGSGFGLGIFTIVDVFFIYSTMRSLKVN